MKSLLSVCILLISTISYSQVFVDSISVENKMYTRSEAQSGSAFGVSTSFKWDVKNQKFHRQVNFFKIDLFVATSGKNSSLDEVKIRISPVHQNVYNIEEDKSHSIAETGVLTMDYERNMNLGIDHWAKVSLLGFEKLFEYNSKKDLRPYFKFVGDVISYQILKESGFSGTKGDFKLLQLGGEAGIDLDLGKAVTMRLSAYASTRSSYDESGLRFKISSKGVSSNALIVEYAFVEKTKKSKFTNEDKNHWLRAIYQHKF